MISVEVDLERDAFTVVYDAMKVDESRIENAVRGLGFKPRVVETRKEPRTRGTTPPAAIREPIASAVAEARASGRLVLVDFYAEWCAPCKVLDAEVMPAPVVQRQLKGFVLVKVDTDRYPEAGKSYHIATMPTLVILDGKGVERDRVVGMIGAEALAERLATIRSNTAESATSRSPR